MTQLSSHAEQPDTDDLAQTLATLARSLEEADDSSDTLGRIVAAAAAMIPGAAEGSISLVAARRRMRSFGASGELPLRVDALQTEVGEGPCLDAMFEQRTVSVPDMATEMRWPRFATRAARLGAGSMLAFQLFVSGDNLGALNLYAYEPHAFDEDSEHVGTLFAAHAAVALSAVRREERQQVAMDSRNVIGQAQGILMERHGLSAQQAFELLIEASQARNVKLRDVAGQLADGGRL